MKISIIGAGNIGAKIGRKWAANNQEIIYGLRDPSKDIYQSLRGDNISLLPIQEAVEASEMIVLAVPFNAVGEVIGSFDGWPDKIIVDCTNPLSGIPAEFDSGAEYIAGLSNCSRVIKAFNSTGAENLANPKYEDMQIDTFICGNDQHAKDIVRQLAEVLGFSVVDAGALDNAHLLEYFAMFWINLAYKQGMGPNIGFKLLKRP